MTTSLVPFLVLTSSDGGKAVDIAWPLAALTVTAMVVLPVMVVAEVMVIVAALRGEDRPVAATSPRGGVDPEA